MWRKIKPKYFKYKEGFDIAGQEASTIFTQKNSSKVGIETLLEVLELVLFSRITFRYI